MRIILISALLAFATCVMGQNNKSFVLPQNARFSPGKVLVKVKSNYKDALSGNAAGRIKGISFSSAKPLVNQQLAAKGASLSRSVVAKPVIDISQYYEIRFDPALSIEDFINQLYSTGYFDLVEPAYLYATSYVPNDPSVSKQYYLNTIKAIQAWDITKGSSDITIAIVDTGGDLDHPDLAANLYVNTKEIPNNGIDDDSDGYIDNYRGWDFVGNDTLNLNNPSYAGDNDPSVHVGGDISHGTWAAGCAGAATDNNLGIAGVGFHTRIMFTKHTADNQKSTNGTIYSGYEGMLYAANQGIKIINCSWGSSFQSQIIQDLINHMTLDLGCLIVAAAGNGGGSTPVFPGAYENVLSVAATDKNDKLASFTTYGKTVDLAAPGVGIYTTGYNDTYSTVDGTSFSAPITSGAAALVWAKNPTFTGRQVAEQLRITSDASALYAANSSYKNLLGHGRLDIQAALTLELPSVRASHLKFVTDLGSTVQAGQSGNLTADFTNYLKSTSSGITVTLSTISSYVTITKNSISPGIINTNETINNSVQPFQLKISATVPENTNITLVLTYSDGSYSDTQALPLLINPSYIDVNTNLINTTVSSLGRLGFQDPANQAQGVGFLFNQEALLFEMGLIMGTSSTNLYNNVRGAEASGSSFDQDFVSTAKITLIRPGLRSDAEIFGEFANSATPASQNIVVDYRSLAWKEAPADKFVILEYKIKNAGATAMNGFYFGIFADWDITTSGTADAANWYPDEKLGYVYPAVSAAKPNAGIQLLTGPAKYYSIDNDQAIAGNPFGLYDGFSDVEKFTSISTQRLTAGTSTGAGNDVSHVVSSGPYAIASGETITIAFALHAAVNTDELKASAAAADIIYNYTLKAPVPVVDTVKICYNTPATINGSGASVLKWYKTFTGGTSFFTGSQLVTGNLLSDTVFYVSNGDNSYESVRKSAVVLVKANPVITTSGSTTLCQGQSITLSVSNADSYAWSNGAKTKTIQVSTEGVFSVTVKNNELGCESTSASVTTTLLPAPAAVFTTTGQTAVSTPIQFTDQSTDAIAWFWNFGNGATSTAQNPLHTYASVKNYTVTLTVTAANQCQNTVSHSIAVITGIENSDDHVFVYPNPVHSSPLSVEVSQPAGSTVSLWLVNMLGQILHSDAFQTADPVTTRNVPVDQLQEGIYLLKIKTSDGIVTRKIVKAQ